MQCAMIYASLSYCNRLKVGCVIVKDDKIISIGYNGQPPGYPNVCECSDGKTLPTVLHAEMNALTKLAKSHESGNGASMFITHAPCLKCALLILSSGIKEVFYNQPYRCNDGIELLENNNISCKQVHI